jgi:hypothetical protein
MLRLCGPAAEKPKVVKSCFFTSKKKTLPMLHKMPKMAPF